MALIRLDVTAKPFEDGRAFGRTGAYEELRGTATFALEPSHPANAVITDLGLAPVEADGRVHFSADVMVLRPVDPARGSRKLLLDVVNRGNPVAVRMMDDNFYQPGQSPGAGCGWLFERGYVLGCCGWQHDVPRGHGMFGLAAPRALLDGKPISGRIMSVQQPSQMTRVLRLADATGLTQHEPYAADDLEQPDALLIERDYPFGPPREVPRSRWRFARVQGGQVIPDGAYVYSEEGFQAGKTYQVIYTTSGAPVTGTGLAATRDFVSFLRFGGAAAGNPCAGEIDWTLAFGASQTGRFLRQMLYLGFCEDEQGRLAIDGLLPHIAGSRHIETNWRFGQPSYNGADSMSNHFPYTDADQTDPVSGQTDGLQSRARRAGRLPKVVHTNSSCEYWASQAALIHATIDGASDAAIPDNVRIFHFSGTQHVPAPLPLPARAQTPNGTGLLPPNTLDYKPLLRAALANLDAWVTEGIEPPPSRYPRLSDGTLVNQSAARQMLARLPGQGPPDHVPSTARMDFGASAVATGVAAVLPPRVAEPLPALVPAVDDDGNELGGLRHPELAAPLATYSGWNPREVNGQTALLNLTGATIPFAATSRARQAAADPRASIEERYASREGFLGRIREAAAELVQQRYLLPRDAQSIESYAGRRFDELSGAGKAGA